MKTMKKVMAALLVLTMVLGLTSIAFAKTTQKYFKGDMVKFSGSAYGYEKAGAKKSSVIVKKGSIAEVYSSKLKNGKEWVEIIVDDEKETHLFFSADYLKDYTGSKGQKIVFAAGGSERSQAEWVEDTKAEAQKGKYVKATGKVNIRQTPGLAGKSVAILQKGKKLKWTGEAYKDSRGITFYGVKYTYKKQKTCYVSAAYSEIVK